MDEKLAIAYHNYWLVLLKKQKGVLGVVHLKSTSSPKFSVLVTMNTKEGKKKFKYLLKDEPNNFMDDEYQYILREIKSKV